MFKNFYRIVGDFKLIAGLYFMAAVVITMVVRMFMGATEFAFLTLWQLLGFSIVLGGLHYIYFSKLSTPAKISIHCILTYLTLMGFSYFCSWGLVNSVGAFWITTGAFIFVYVVVVLAFLVFYKSEEEFLNKKLIDFKEERK